MLFNNLDIPASVAICRVVAPLCGGTSKAIPLAVREKVVVPPLGVRKAHAGYGLTAGLSIAIPRARHMR